MERSNIFDRPLVERAAAKVLHMHMARRPRRPYNGVMELVASFAVFGLLVAGWMVSGKRRTAAE
jgi:hypothetical protein